MLKEFKDFALKGNVVDMAVGILIGGAFGKIIASLVGDVIMPVIGKAMGGVSFTDLFVDLSGKGYRTLAEAEAAGAAVMKYGAFIQNGFDFVIIAFCIFLMVKKMNSMKKAEEAAAPAAPPANEVLLAEIRDLLKK